jgi:hypothetical protein
MDNGVKRVFDSVMIKEICDEIELAKHKGWIIYDAAGYDTIELVYHILLSVDYIEKDFAFSLVEQLREIERERNRAYDKINGVNFDYDED